MERELKIVLQTASVIDLQTTHFTDTDNAVGRNESQVALMTRVGC